MIRNIKTCKSIALKLLGILWNLSLFTLRALISFASDEPSKIRYTAGKAQQLYEDGTISGSECARHLQGD